jgi:hypothetical protein
MKNNFWVFSIHHVFCVLLGTLELCVIGHIGIVLILEACGVLQHIRLFYCGLVGFFKISSFELGAHRNLVGFCWFNSDFLGSLVLRHCAVPYISNFSRVPSKYTEHCSLLSCFG